ncbi:uncharacterized protein LOC141685315 [Apium graveolens]|uniref:uncharacterized protein LOC141685315 n=1 Tax=Apium graveolens TaxID=4045 RepID=UPI003D790CC2
MSDNISDSASIIDQSIRTPTTQNPTTESHSIQITTIRLNGENFQRWSQSVRMYIRGRGKIGYLTGDKKEPDAKDATYSTWDVENSMVMTWLVNSMKEDISSNFMCYHTAKELWDNVNQMYSDLENQSQVYELTLKLGEICHGEDNVTKYFNSLKCLWQDLDLYSNYEWKSPEDCNHYKKTVEDNRIFKFLIGLNVEFDEVRGRIIARKPLPSMGEVFSEFRREESRRLVMLGKRNLMSIVEKVENSALVVGTNFGRVASKRTDEKPRIWCDHCNKPHHTRETCWKVHGKPTNWKGSHEGRFNRSPAAHEAKFVTLNEEEHFTNLLKLLNSNPGLLTAPNASVAHTDGSYSAIAGKGAEFGEDDWQC